MAFTPPQFNVLCDVWVFPRVPRLDLPDYENEACQFYVTPKGQFFLEPVPFTWFPPPIYLRFPYASALVWEKLFIAECPPESGRYFRAYWKEILHLGFPNQYRLVIVEQCDDMGQPISRFVDRPLSPVQSGAEVLGVNLSVAGIATRSASVPHSASMNSAAVLVQLYTIGSAHH